MLKKIVVLSLILYGIAVFAENKVLVEYFYQPNCEDCRKVAEFILKPMNEKYGSQVLLKKYNLSKEKNFLLLISILDKLHDNSNAHAYMVVNRSKVLAGYSAIEKNLFITLKSPPTLPSSGQIKTKNTTNSIGERLTLITVLTAGFIDGINPCVFSTLIFFMSLLAVSKIKGARLFIVGSAYCLASFITYLLLGFGLFKVLKSLSYFSWLRTGLNWGMIIILLFFALLSFRDALRFAKSDGNTKKITLQLPRRIKLLIHRMMRSGLNFRYLFLGAFFIGVAVTILESVCTGQVYIPTLILLSNKDGVTSKWFIMLTLYNVVFIIPLVGVFVLMFSGISAFKAIKLTKINLLIGKIALGTFFLILACIMLYF